ncbi:MAG: MGH1-like glycoside hydrolase domain-containing protein [Acidimicrobiales bacterium]
MSGDTLSAVEAHAVLERHWRPPGFCVPNATTYPWQWLWDSCFHAICWAHLGEGGRAVAELGNVLAHQAPDGFVPHLTYWDGADVHADFWGRRGSSSITQPPMYGHAVAELIRRGVPVPEPTVSRARKGLAFLLHRTGSAGAGAGGGPGVPIIVHPWESGCDDSPRWDAWCPGGWTFERWKQGKGDLVAALQHDGRSPVGNDLFEVASPGFAALVAFNVLELAEVTGDDSQVDAAQAVVAWLAERWRADATTWVDEVLVGPTSSGAVRTLDALLPVLVTDDEGAIDAALAVALDDRAFGGPFGPAAVHRDEPAFDPTAYWRGPAWPQLTYLLWVAARRRGRPGAAADLAGRLVAGARRSGLAEYWHPDTGLGLGAVPQSWAALATVVAPI